MTAADKAPNLLPKMESVTDAMRGLGTVPRDHSNDDAKAIVEQGEWSQELTEKMIQL